MKSYKGVLRLFGVFLIGSFIIGYNIYGTFSREIPQNSTLLSFQEDNDFVFMNETESTPKDTQSESVSVGEVSSEAVSSSLPASTSGSYKGKILSQYISPYKAGLSYDKVYLKNSTQEKIDIKKLLQSDLSFKIQKNSQPQVLIVHTHTTETFMQTDENVYTTAFNSRSRDKTKNMVSIGRIVAEKLNTAGIKTLHAETEHDYPQYTGSYTRAAKTINSYLKKYPSIKVVLDLHRDAVTSGNDKVKLVTEIGGKKAGQVMLVMGTESGKYWQENLKLAIKLQQTMETKYPTLARPLSLVAKGYNQGLTKGSLLIEFGTDVNTLSEVHYSAEMVGNALAEVLSKAT